MCGVSVDIWNALQREFLSLCLNRTLERIDPDTVIDIKLVGGRAAVFASRGSRL